MCGWYDGSKNFAGSSSKSAAAATAEVVRLARVLGGQALGRGDLAVDLHAAHGVGRHRSKLQLVHRFSIGGVAPEGPETWRNS